MRGRPSSRSHAAPRRCRSAQALTWEATDSLGRTEIDIYVLTVDTCISSPLILSTGVHYVLTLR